MPTRKQGWMNLVMTDALIHLRVPAATKARWVQKSRAEGMRLTDWITEKVEGMDQIDKPLYHVVSVSKDGNAHSSYQRANSPQEAIETARYYMLPQQKNGEITAVLVDDED